jgi:integrase/recombinase XerD
MKFAKIEEYDEITKLKIDRIQKLLENWVIDQKSRNLKSATIKAKLNAVELFLEMNKKLFHKKILHKLIPSDDCVSGGQKPFTDEEIRQMLTATTKLRTKALIHFFASTGSRPSSIADPILRIKHIESIGQGCKVVRIYDGSKEGYWGFLTPEAATALDNYLKSRRLNGEEIGPESPVFINTESKYPTKK